MDIMIKMIIYISATLNTHIHTYTKQIKKHKIMKTVTVLKI